MIVYILDESVGILGETEEIALLLCLFNGSAAVGTFAVDKLSVEPEGFTGSAVPAFVFALIYIALVVELLEYFLNDLYMAVIGSADKVIVRDVH